MKPEPMVEVQYSSAYPSLTARLVEFSPQHLCLGLEDPLPPRVDVLVRLRFPGEVQVVEVAGQVLWSDQDTMFVEVRPGAPGSGVERGRSAGETSVLSSFRGSGIRESSRGGMAEQGRLDRRRYPRGIVGSATKGRVNGMDEAPILNLSLAGALIEHTEFLRLGTVSYLDLLLLGRKERVRCYVVRSAVQRRELQPDGEEALIYQTGLEFLGPSHETQVGDQRLHSVDYRSGANDLRGPGRHAGKQKLGLERTQERLIRQGLVYLPASTAEATTMEAGEAVPLGIAVPLGRRGDSRQESRIPLEVPVGCRLLDAADSCPAEPLIGEIKDVSQGGAQLWLSRRLPLFSRVKVFMRIRELNFQGRAEIMGAEVRPKGGRYRHGLRWLVLNAQAKTALSQVIPQLI